MQDVTSDSTDLLGFERVLIERGEVVVGIDEVGRGALAGPLTVGAVVLGDIRTVPEGLNDSKQITPRRRQGLVVPLREWADGWALGEASPEEIDAWGLRTALAVAATRALDRLRVRPTYALLDGDFNLLSAPMALGVADLPVPELRYATMAHESLVRGDARCATIAAASVLAKVDRDAFMVGLDPRLPVYRWESNKGYGSREHLEALAVHGPSEWHRRSWSLPALRSLAS